MANRKMIQTENESNQGNSETEEPYHPSARLTTGISSANPQGTKTYRFYFDSIIGAYVVCYVSRLLYEFGIKYLETKK